MSEVDSNDFVCDYSREKHETELLLQSYKMSRETMVLFQIWITFCLKTKCCLTVCNETLAFYYLLLQHVEEYNFFFSQCVVAKNVFQNNV